MSFTPDPESREKEFVLEDIIKEFHTDESFRPDPPKQETPAEPAPEPEINPSLLDDTFDTEMEQSLRVIFGKNSKTAEPAARRGRRARAAERAEKDSSPFSSDVFNEVYEERRSEPAQEEPSMRTTTIRLRRHGSRTAPLSAGGEEGMERLGEGRSPDPHVDPESLLTSMRRSLRSVSSRLPIILLLCLPLLYITLSIPLRLPLPGFLSYIDHPFIHVFTQLLVMTAVGIAGLDILTNGFYSLFCLRPGGDSLISLSFLASMLHCLGIIFFPEWGGYLPVCVLPALSIFFSLLGDYYNMRARVLSLRAALRTQDGDCSTLIRESNGAKRTYLRAAVSGRTAFYDNLNHSDAASRSLVWFAPVGSLLALICAIICVVRSGSPGMFFWSYSMITAVLPLFGLFTCCALPYYLMARKCHKHGIAVGNCEAVISFASSGSYCVTDGDLYPTGTVKSNGYKMFSAHSKEQVLAFTEAAIRASGSALAPIFADILRDECITPLQAGNVEFSGHGGIRTEIGGRGVMLGTSHFMERAGLSVPEGVPVRNSIFIAIDMTLCAAFSVRYEQQSRVSSAMDILLRGGREPRLASRNFAVTAAEAEELFELPAGSLSPLPTETQVALNNPDRACEAEAVLFLREGLSGPAVFLECARRYARAVRLSTVISLAAAAVGCCLLCLLSANAWTSSVTPWFMLGYMTALSLPGWLIGFWVSKF